MQLLRKTWKSFGSELELLHLFNFICSASGGNNKRVSLQKWVGRMQYMPKFRAQVQIYDIFTTVWRCF